MKKGTQHNSNEPHIPRRISSDKQFIGYLINQLSISDKGKAYLLHYLLYASSKCRHSKLLYYIITSCTIIFPVFVTLLTTCSMPWAKCISSILISATSIAAASLSLFKFHEKWTRYRNYIEKTIAMIVDDVYGTSSSSKNDGPEGPEPSSTVQMEDSEFTANVAITRLENQILSDFNKLNREHQHLWVQERERDQVEPNKNG